MLYFLRLLQPRLRVIPVGLALLLGAAQSLSQAPIIQPGPPGQPGRIISAEEASDLANIAYSEADIRFLQGMISHHTQALEMSELVESRSTREEVEALAGRIVLSQEDEIGMMVSWLEERGFDVPDAMAHHSEDFDLMPGMISHEEMLALEQASGPEFDRLYLRYMIEHHVGALEMVETLLDQDGSAQDPLLYEFTSEVTSDQRSEIERMDALLASFSLDPRVNLAAGFRDAGEAAMNMRLIASLPKPPGFYDPDNPAGLPARRQREVETLNASASGEPPPQDGSAAAVAEPVSTPAPDAPEQPQDEAEDEEDENSDPRPSLLRFSNTDLLFSGDVAVAGNYHGFNIYDISNPTSPQLMSSVVCPGGQGDVSLVGNLLIMSVQEGRGRLDCGLEGVGETVSQERVRGIRIFDVSDMRMPVQVGVVQTCRGSHTHTVVSDLDDEDNIYVYVSGTSRARDDEELAGCSNDSPFENPESALFRIEVIQIPVNNPGAAQIVNRPFIFADAASGVLAGLWEGGDHGPDTQDTSETNQCHDITTFPEIGLAAGACSGNGILLDISDPANPARLHEVVDPGFAYWHSATFNNDGSKVIFTDEWGGGTRPRCRAQDPIDWGADAFYDVIDNQLVYRSHYKMPAPQTEQENCVAHNGSLIPVPGRDIFVQAWYQGGISIVDFTDSSNPVEIAFFDRGPIDAEEMVSGGYWSAYWYGGQVYGTEIARGLDVFELEPSDFITANEIAAASLREANQVVNAQTQRRVVWPAAPVVALAYLDQLQRDNAITGQRRQALDAILARAGEQLDNNRSDADLARELGAQVAGVIEEAGNHDGRDRSRYLALAETLEGIANRLR